jgi:hypothetical protein
MIEYGVHSPVTIISKNLHFTFIQLMMYMVFIIDHIHHLMNESKMLTFAYISDRRVYLISILFFIDIFICLFIKEHAILSINLNLNDKNIKIVSRTS